jgi:Flp pilus assembly protein TadD
MIPRSRWTKRLMSGLTCVLFGCATFTSERLLTRPKPDMRETKTSESSALPTTPLRYVDSDKLRAEACLRTAGELAKAGQDEHAIAQFQRARTFDADIQGVAHPLAVCYDRIGRFDDARHEYDTALQASPRDPQLLNDLGMHHLHKQDWAEAERYFRNALKYDPKHPCASTNLGIVLAEQGRYTEAESAFAESATEAAAASNVAMFLARHGRRDEAEAKFREALSREPSLQPASDGLALLTEHADTRATARVD